MIAPVTGEKGQISLRASAPKNWVPESKTRESKTGQDRTFERGKRKRRVGRKEGEKWRRRWGVSSIGERGAIYRLSAGWLASTTVESFETRELSRGLSQQIVLVPICVSKSDWGKSDATHEERKIQKQLQTIVEASVLREVTMLDRKGNSCIKQRKYLQHVHQGRCLLVYFSTKRLSRCDNVYRWQKSCEPTCGSYTFPSTIISRHITIQHGRDWGYNNVHLYYKAVYYR